LPPAHSLLDGKPWLRLDTGEGDEQRLLVFHTNDGRASLATSNYWMGDGTFGRASLATSNYWMGDDTFGVAPRSALQLYTILAGVHRERLWMIFFPAVYVIMVTKTKESYTRVFQNLNLALNKVGPVYFSYLVPRGFEFFVNNENKPPSEQWEVPL
jgi:hypothetical protein